MADFADEFDAVLEAAVARHRSKSAVASDLGLPSQKLYGIPKNPYLIDHERLLRLAGMAELSPARTLELESSWCRARLEKGNPTLFQLIWRIIGELPASKAKHAWRNLVDAYVRSVAEKKSR